jgi:hypothetical protein
MPNFIKLIRKSMGLIPYRFYKLLNGEGLACRLTLQGYLHKERAKVSRLTPGEIDQLRRVTGLSAQEFWDKFISPAAAVEPRRKAKRGHKRIASEQTGKEPNQG